jgi:hypothetical protein
MDPELATTSPQQDVLPPSDDAKRSKKGQAAPPSAQFTAAMEKWRAEPALTPKQLRAIETLEACRTSSPPCKWDQLTAEDVLTQGIERVRHPFTTDIHGPYFCGPTFLMSVITEKEPERFAELVVEILTRGKFDGKKVDKDLLAAKPSNSGNTSVDWLFMSAMRNTHPNMFGEYQGEDDDAAKKERSLLGSIVGAGHHELAGTSVGTMKNDIKDVLGYKVVKSKYFWVQDLITNKDPDRFVEHGLPDMIERLPATYDPEERTICGILIGFGSASGENIFKSMGELSDLPDAIHWNRIVTKPVLGADGNYTFELFEHGNKRTETWSPEKLNKEVYGYVIAERRGK